MSFDTRKGKQNRSYRLHCSLPAHELKLVCGTKHFPAEGTWKPSYNLFPGDTIPVLTQIANRPGRPLTISLCQWGIPFEQNGGGTTASAISKAETLWNNTSVCDKEFQRGLVVCQGWFAWSSRIRGSRKAADSRSQIYYMRPNDPKKAMLLAALVRSDQIYHRIKSTYVKTKQSVKIISRPIVTNEDVMPAEWQIICTRMPLILNDHELEDWLNPKLTIRRFLDRRSPDKCHSLPMDRPFHVGFWICDPNITDKRVLQSRKQWDMKIAAEEFEIRKRVKAREEEAKTEALHAKLDAELMKDDALFEAEDKLKEGTMFSTPNKSKSMPPFARGTPALVGGSGGGGRGKSTIHRGRDGLSQVPFGENSITQSFTTVPPPSSPTSRLTSSISHTRRDRFASLG